MIDSPLLFQSVHHIEIVVHILTEQSLHHIHQFHYPFIGNPVINKIGILSGAHDTLVSQDRQMLRNIAKNGLEQQYTPTQYCQNTHRNPENPAGY
jgi:hypothetical protein